MSSNEELKPCIDLSEDEKMIHESDSDTDAEEEGTSPNAKSINQNELRREELSPVESLHEINIPEANLNERPVARKEENIRNEINPKAKEIEKVLNTEPIDLEKLKLLSITKDGLVTDELRKRAWPKLLHLENIKFISDPTNIEITDHKDYSQVVLDVNRTLKRFPPNIDTDERVLLMKQLTKLIIRVLHKHPHLHYYQGYHDVAITFLLVTGESIGYQMVESLSLSHLYDFMRPNMERTIFYLTYLYPILRKANQRLYDHLMRSKVGTMFCLPWLITWYAHTLSDYRHVVRLYDFFLASHYLMPMYIAVAIVIHRQERIFAEECDMAMQHYVLSQVPDDLPFEKILTQASSLFTLYPPDGLHTQVDDLVQKFKEEDEAERRKLQERKANRAMKRESSNLLLHWMQGRSLTYWQRTWLKMTVLAITASLATGFYGYYTNSTFLVQYWQYFKKSS